MTTKQLVLARTFSTNDVVKIIGCSYRQLDYWCRTGLIPGQPVGNIGSGRRRRWTEEDIRRARLIYLASQLSNQPLDKTVAMLERELFLRQMDIEVHALTEGGAA